jgi:hypothetical protein
MEKYLFQKRPFPVTYPVEDTLSHFYGVGTPSAFSTVDKLQRGVKSVQGHTHAVTRPDVSAFLESQDTYTMHKPVRKRFPCNAYIANVLYLWHSHLLDLQKFAKYNNNYRFVLSVIDVFQSSCI